MIQNHVQPIVIAMLFITGFGVIVFSIHGNGSSK